MFDVNNAVTANDRTNIGLIASPKDWRLTLQAMEYNHHHHRHHTHGLTYRLGEMKNIVRP